MLSILSELEIARLAMVWYLVQASQALQAVQAVQPMLHGESPPMMTPLQQVRLFKNKHYEILIYQNLVTFASIPTHYSRTPPSCLQWTRPRLLQLSSTALFRSTLLYRLVLIWSPNNLMSQIIAVINIQNCNAAGFRLACRTWRRPCVPGCHDGRPSPASICITFEPAQV